MPHCRRSKSDHERGDEEGKGKDARDPAGMMTITMMSNAAANGDDGTDVYDARDKEAKVLLPVNRTSH
jgi:hypothetical protein